MESHLPAFKEKNPQLEVVTELIRGQHPHLKGYYSKILVLTCSVTKFFSVVIDDSPMLLYESECWMVKRNNKI